MLLGQRLKEIRKLRGFTQKEMAEQLHISRSTYAHYEISNREPDLETLKSMAAVLQVSLDYLSGKSDFPSSAEWLVDFITRRKIENPELLLAELDLSELKPVSNDHKTTDNNQTGVELTQAPPANRTSNNKENKK